LSFDTSIPATGPPNLMFYSGFKPNFQFELGGSQANNRASLPGVSKTYTPVRSILQRSD